MGLETGTYIADLVSTNPAVTDQEAQGANHLQLIKSVLLNTFPGANRARPFPTLVTINASHTILKSEAGSIFATNTSGASVTFTLPTLVLADAGWAVKITKTTTDTNPMFVVPATGTLQSGDVVAVGSARRCIPGMLTDIIWTGSIWFVSRSPAVPIGTVLEYNGASLPTGYEWPNGQTLALGQYPELIATVGSRVTPDRRGRYAAGKDNLGGTAANRITNGTGGIAGTTLGATGGVQALTLTRGQLPTFTPTGSVSSSFSCTSGGTITIPMHVQGTTSTVPSVSGSIASGNYTQSLNTDVTGTVSSTFTGDAIGSGNSIQQLPPTIIMNYIYVVE